MQIIIKKIYSWDKNLQWNFIISSTILILKSNQRHLRTICKLIIFKKNLINESIKSIYHSKRLNNDLNVPNIWEKLILNEIINESDKNFFKKLYRWSCRNIINQITFK